MCLRGGSFFQFSKICLHFSAVCLQFFNKTNASQTHFGFINLGSEMLSFWIIALRKGEFWVGSPCKMKLFQTYQLATTAKAEIRRNFMLLLQILTVECSRNSKSHQFIVTFGGQLVRRSAYCAIFKTPRKSVNWQKKLYKSN